MPGNEIEVVKYLVTNKGGITLPKLGLIISVEAPSSSGLERIELNSVNDVDEYLSSEDSRKKADIYINSRGVSLKQLGAAFPYNRLQRANLPDVFKALRFDRTEHLLHHLDKTVKDFHEEKICGRDRPWEDFFSEEEFKLLLEYLMMKGSPNVGVSSHLAEFILEAPTDIVSPEEIEVYTINEYFNKYRDKLKISIRRQWIGQVSKTEHARAKGLAKKPGNAPWVFNNVSGEPKLHSSGYRWRQNIPVQERKTVYMIMIGKQA